MNRKKTIMVILPLLLFMALGSGIVMGGVFRVPIVSDISSLDPALLSHTHDRVVAQQVFQGLVTFDYSVEAPFPVIPVLAKSYTVDDDAKGITFYLQEGVKFHFGYGELTAEDVVFSMSRHRDPAIGSLEGALYDDVEKIEALDDYTVRVVFREPTAFTFLQNISFQGAGFILSKKAYQELDGQISRKPVGTGPFYFERWEAGERVILKKFPEYWRALPQLEQVEFWQIPEEIVALGALQAGELNLVPITMRGSYDMAEAIDVTIVESMGDARIYIYYVNFKAEPMDNILVRRALAHALDIDSIVERIGPQVMRFPSPLASMVFAATDDFWTYDYDLDKARALLAEAGYPNGFDLTLIYNRSGLYEPIAMEVANSWNQVVNVKLELVERAVWGTRLREYNHHVAAWGLARYAPFLFAQAYLTDSPRNYSQYSNPAIDDVIMKAQTALTEEDSLYYWREFQRLATEEVFNFWACNGKSMVAVSNNVEGVIVMPTPSVYILEFASMK